MTAPSETAPFPGSAATGPRRTVELTGAQALGLLGRASLGRIVFTQRALPAIRPVNHLLDHGRIVILTHEDSDLYAQARDHGDRGVVVAYQADDIDPLTHLGWSVVVTGYCRPVRDPDALTRYQRLLRPWSGPVMNCAVRIRPHLITGIRLTV
ncbi:pyridoxamine 5'-phosphate oxidase family protein [Streptomyces sp. NPDC056178]|uniref:pyridoxamine 5'-phosphate oxidase family protein n=1 Tax=unclassified Streptomyces TaxID=2593676 RepID=UPI0035E28414